MSEAHGTGRSRDRSLSLIAAGGLLAIALLVLLIVRLLEGGSLDLFTDPELLKAAQAYHREATGGKAYRSPVPADQKPTLP